MPMIKIRHAAELPLLRLVIPSVCEATTSVMLNTRWYASGDRGCFKAIPVNQGRVIFITMRSSKEGHDELMPNMTLSTGMDRAIRMLAFDGRRLALQDENHRVHIWRFVNSAWVKARVIQTDRSLKKMDWGKGCYSALECTTYNRDRIDFEECMFLGFRYWYPRTVIKDVKSLSGIIFVTDHVEMEEAPA